MQLWVILNNISLFILPFFFFFNIDIPGKVVSGLHSAGALVFLSGQIITGKTTGSSISTGNWCTVAHCFIHAI